MSSQPLVSAEDKPLPKKQVAFSTVQEYHVESSGTPLLSSPLQHSTIPSRRGAAWVPWSLHRVSLIALMLILVSILATLLSLQHVTLSQHGLRMLTSNHYTWTYGPTAVFVIIVGLWRQVDYHCKALTPWSEMQRGPVHADRSVLLDYVSPFILVTLVHAARKRHLIVVLTTIGFLVLKVVTVASTGLLIVGSTVVTVSDVPMTRTAVLDPTANHSIPVDEWRPESVVDTSDPTGTFTFDMRSAYGTYGALAKGLPRPDGVHSALTFEPFHPTAKQPSLSYSYTATTRAFVPYVSCRSVAADLVGNINRDTETFLGYSLHNDTTFYFSPRSKPWNPMGIGTLGRWVSPPQLYLPNFVAAPPCNSSLPGFTSNTLPLMIALSDVRIKQAINDSSAPLPSDTLPTILEYDAHAEQVMVLICQARYELHSVPVTYQYTAAGAFNASVGKSTPTDPIQMENLSDVLLAMKLLGIEAFGKIPMFSRDGAEAANTSSPFWNTLVAHTGKNYTLLLADPEAMLRGTEEVLTEMLLQSAHYEYLTGTNETSFHDSLRGGVSHAEDRLTIASAALYTMLGGVAALVLVVTVVMFGKPSTPTILNTESIIVNARTLQDSQDFQERLSQLAWLSESSATSYLHDVQYYTKCSNNDVCMIQVDGATVRHGSVDTEQTECRYAPLTLTTTWLVLTFVSAILLIAALELTQHFSDRAASNALMLKDPTTFNVVIFTRILPATVMLLVATMFNALDFNAALLAPFEGMHRHPLSSHALHRPLVSQIPLVALYHAFRHGYWAAELTSMSAFVGSMLSIVVSGLLTVEPARRGVAVGLQPSDAWNLSFHQPRFDTDNSSAVMSTLIEGLNLSYPALTHDELAFPDISAIDWTNVGGAGSPGLLTARLPALRAHLSCFSQPLLDPMALVTPNKQLVGKAGAVHIALPEGCHRGSQYGNESFIELHFPQITSSGYGPPSNQTYFGNWIDLHVGPWPDYGDGSSDAIGVVPAEQPDNPPGCPSSFLVYGYMDLTNMSASNVNVHVCEQEVHRVMTDVTFVLPSWRISADHPPVTDESNVQVLRSGSRDETAFWWRLTLLFRDYLAPLKYTPERSSQAGRMMDSAQLFPFFRVALQGQNQMAMESLQHAEDNEKTFDYIHSYYRRYMAQFFSNNMRVAAPDGSSEDLPDEQGSLLIKTDRSTATFVPDEARQRITQHRKPKLVLQVMLAFMIISSGTALMIGKFRRLVLWNPATIAGTAVLFAGSRMCESDAITPPTSRDVRPQDQSWKWKGLPAAPNPTTRGIPYHASPITEQQGYPTMDEVYNSADWQRRAANKGFLGSSHVIKHQQGSRDEPTGYLSSDTIMSTSIALDQATVHRRRVARAMSDDGDSSAGRPVMLRLGWWRNGVYYGPERPSALDFHAATKASTWTHVKPPQSTSQPKWKWKFGSHFASVEPEGNDIDTMKSRWQTDDDHRNAKWRYGIDIYDENWNKSVRQ